MPGERAGQDGEHGDLAHRLGHGGGWWDGGGVLSDVTLIPLDDHFVAFSERGQVLASLNPSAALVVRELQIGRPPSEIAGLLASHGYAADGRAPQWIDATLHALTSNGLLDSGAGPHQQDASVQDGDGSLDISPYEPVKPVLEQRYRLLDTCALIRFGAWAQARLVNSVLGHLVIDEPCSPSTVIELKAISLENHTMRTEIYRDGLPYDRAHRLSWLGPIVKAALWQSAINAHEFLFNLHAGVVGTGETCVLLPAAQGSGKSSLTMALLHRGFRYFSDEVALIEPGEFRVPPMPLAMSIKDTGWQVMAPYCPDLETLPIHIRCDGKVLRYVPPPANLVGDKSAPVSHIIFPRYDADGPTELRGVSKASALGRAMGECLGLRQRLDGENVRALVRWIDRIDCYELTFNCLEKAADLVVGAAGSPTPLVADIL